MNSSLIGKIEKAKRYAQERGRVPVRGLRVEFDGENDRHEVDLDGEHWRCNCDFFAGWGNCAHTMALELMLDGMLPMDDSLRQSGHFGPRVHVPDDADTQTRLLGFIGRTP